MYSFSQFLTEQREPGLTIFDIDDTLFHTQAKVKVIKDNTVIHQLSSSEYNSYKLKPGEAFDYSEFRSAKHFAETSKPINRMVAKLKAILRNVKNTENSKVIIVTARNDFDERDVFLDAFRKHGIDIDSIRVERAGKLPGSSATAKKAIFTKYLQQGYKRVRLFDDHPDNLDALLSLKREFPDTKIEAYLALPNGSIKTYKG